MLRDLTIKNYRCFKDFSIDGLARVNLIVGQNNSGKTSFLEAVYLLVNQGNQNALLELLDNRGEYSFDASLANTPSIYYDTAHIFHGYEPQPDSQGAEILIASRCDTPLSTKIEVATQSNYYQRLPQISRQGTRPFELRFTFADEAVATFHLLTDYSYPTSLRFSRLRDLIGPYRFVGMDVGDFDYLSALWDGIFLDPSKEALLVEALQLVDTTVEDVRFTTRRTANGAVVKLRDRQQRVPLSSMGEGMRRTLSLVMSVVVAEGGILCVDEIDTGLYHGIHTDLWRLLIETAQRRNVQIFATTHNWECIAAFQEALHDSADPSEGQLFRLQVRGEDVIPVDYSSDMLDVAVSHAIEVR